MCHLSQEEAELRAYHEQLEVQKEEERRAARAQVGFMV